MATVLRTDQAENDLASIFEYIAEDNSTAAEKLLWSIANKCELLADNPNIGINRPDLHEAVCSFPVGNYVIFYQLCRDGILILRVLHGARDINCILFD